MLCVKLVVFIKEESDLKNFTPLEGSKARDSFLIVCARISLSSP